MADHVSIICNVCEVLNKHSVEYLVIGGTAVGLYGYYRMSMARNGQLVDKPDIDIWYSSTYPNYFKLLDALEGLRIDVTKHRAETAPNPKESFFNYGFEDYTLDCLPSIKAPLKFWQAYARKEIVPYDGVEIPLISREDLILDKEALGRPKDLDDVDHLSNLL